MNDYRPVLVVRCFNQQNCIGAAIDSLANQTNRDFDLVVFDDGSTDDSASVISDRLARVDNRGDRRVIRASRNLGIGDGIQFLAKQLPENRMLISLDGDDIALPERVHVMRETAERHKSPLLTHGYIPFGSGVDPKPRIPSPFTEEASPAAIAAKRFSGYGLGLSSWTTEAFTRMPPLLANMKSGEDKIIGFRLSLLHKLILIPTPLVRCRVSGPSASRNPGRAKGRGLAEKLLRSYRCSLLTDRQLRADLGHPLASEKYSVSELEAAIALLSGRITVLEREVKALEDGGLSEMMAIIRKKLGAVRA